MRDESKVIWLSQTTLSVDETMTTVARLRERFPTLQDPPSDDICYATQNRQVAVKAMAPECDLVIVVGSTNSSNSVRLVEVALGRRRATRATWSTTRVTSTRRGSTVCARWASPREHRSPRYSYVGCSTCSPSTASATFSR